MRFALYRLVPRGRWLGDLVAGSALVAAALVLRAIVPGPFGDLLAGLVALAALGSFVNVWRDDSPRRGGLP